MTDEQVLPQPMSMLPLRFPVTRLTYGAQQVFSQSVPIDASLDPWGVKVDPPLQTQDFCEDHRSMTSRTLFDASWTFLIEEMTGETEIATFVLSQTSTLKLKIKFEVQREQWLALVHSGEEKMAQHRSASELIGDTLLTRTEVQRLLKIGKTALYEGMKSGLIPEGIRLMNGRTRRWWLSDIKKILGI